MMLDDDIALVRQYAQFKSEEAFATLVSRYINLVYSVAFRQVNDSHLAQEITQTVFITLARKSASLSPDTIVAGWLCRTARHVSNRVLTVQRRREHREHEAYMQAQLDQTESDAAWTQIQPLLESAMAQLGEKDHDVLVLRYLHGRSFREVSAALGTSEAAAKMRVNRALEKLRGIFGKRGVTLSTVVIAGAISANSVQAAPAGLATSVTVAAMKGGAAVLPNLPLLKTTLKLMAWTKLNTAVGIGAIALVAAFTVPLVTHSSDKPAKHTRLTFAGYATPENSVESLLWLASRGEFDKFTAQMTPQESERFRAKKAGRTSDELKQESIAMARAMAGYQVMQKDVISDDEVHLHLSASPSPDGLRTGSVVISMKKIGDEWKLAGDVD